MECSGRRRSTRPDAFGTRVASSEVRAEGKAWAVVGPNITIALSFQQEIGKMTAYVCQGVGCVEKRSNYTVDYQSGKLCKGRHEDACG